jgi:large subunit ribosomal protein L23
VEVEKVRTMLIHGKFRRFGKGGGVLPDWKKAIVTVAKGQKIDFAQQTAS